MMKKDLGVILRGKSAVLIFSTPKTVVKKGVKNSVCQATRVRFERVNMTHT